MAPNGEIFGSNFPNTDLCWDVGAEVAGHVGVHVAEAVEGAEGQMEQEAAADGEVAGQPPRPHRRRLRTHR